MVLCVPSLREGPAVVSLPPPQSIFKVISLFVAALSLPTLTGVFVFRIPGSLSERPIGEDPT